VHVLQISFKAYLLSALELVSGSRTDHLGLVQPCCDIQCSELQRLEVKHHAAAVPHAACALANHMERYYVLKHLC
jgi:hypothetical protein